MYALVTIKKKENNIDVKLYESREEVENEMKLRYNREVKRAEKLNWKHTFYDEKKYYASIDDWIERIEMRCCEVA